MTLRRVPVQSAGTLWYNGDMDSDNDRAKEKEFTIDDVLEMLYRLEASAAATHDQLAQHRRDCDPDCRQ